MNSPAPSPDRSSTLVLIDSIGDSQQHQQQQQQQQQTQQQQLSLQQQLQQLQPRRYRQGSPSTTMTGAAPGHPPDPLLYGLQTMEWRPWLRSPIMDDCSKSPTPDDNSGYERTNSRETERRRGQRPDMHGVRHCLLAGGWCSRLFWTLLWLCAAAGLAYELYRVVDNYWFRHSSYVGSVTTRQDGADDDAIGGLRFPEIYVCPANAINETRRRRYAVDARWYRILTALERRANPTGILGKTVVNWDRPPSPFSGNDTGEWTSPPPVIEVVNDWPVNTVDLDAVREYFMLNGYDTEQFLAECAFRQTPFRCADVAVPTLDRQHGKCFHFPLNNANFTPPGGWRVAVAGQGLSLALNVHTEHYPSFNGSLFDGVYLYIDDRHSPAATQRKPILLPAGANTLLKLRSRHHRLSVDCASAPAKQQTVLNGLLYDADLCKFDCLQQALMDSCDCLALIDARFLNASAVAERRNRSASFGYCTPDQLTDCAFDIVQRYQYGGDEAVTNCTRRCAPACERREYELIGSSSMKLPAESYLGSGPNYPFPWNELKTNYVLLDIVFERAETVLMEERSPLDLDAFLGVTGGLMSLFLGCSLLTVAQLAIFCLSCCKSQCHRVYKGKCLTLRKTLRKMRHSSLLK